MNPKQQNESCAQNHHETQDAKDCRVGNTEGAGQAGGNQPEGWAEEAGDLASGLVDAEDLALAPIWGEACHEGTAAGLCRANKEAEQQAKHPVGDFAQIGKDEHG